MTLPKFPTYQGELPECLHPLKPDHWFLLLHWIFFRPTALKCYLYQAGPQLYRSGPGLGIFRTLGNPAYRNLYMIVPIIIILLAAIISFPYTLLMNWLVAAPMDWSGWLYGLMTGPEGMYLLEIGMGIGIAVSIILGMAKGPIYGIVYGMMIGMICSVIAGIGGAVFGGAMDNVAVAATVYTELGMSLNLPLRIMIALLNFMQRWLFVIGVLIIIGARFGIMFYVAIIALLAMFIGFAESFVVGIIVFLVMLCPLLGFYLFQCMLARFNKSLGIRHPLEWWERVVLPLPLTKKLLLQKLQQDQELGLHFSGEVARNFFQRWTVQAVLFRYLHAHSDPLRFLYVLLGHPQLDEYARIPVKKKDWNRKTTLKHLLLASLALQPVKSRSIVTSGLHRIGWWLTLPLYKRSRTPLTSFVAMLYELLDQEKIEVKNFTLSSYRQIYTKLSVYPGGREIAGTFRAMAAFLSYSNLRALPRATDMASKLIVDHPIRPSVLTALNHLGEVGAEIATYQDSSSQAEQLAALARATNALKELNEYVQAEVIAPEQFLLQRIIRQWQHLINKAEGELSNI